MAGANKVEQAFQRIVEKEGVTVEQPHGGLTLNERVGLYTKGSTGQEAQNPQQANQGASAKTKADMAKAKEIKQGAGDTDSSLA
eukprot:SM000003S11247  [mRNA]  locus=s3:1623936:1624598:- [translate_table: standard]